jgi:hypothetical protein
MRISRLIACFVLIGFSSSVNSALIFDNGEVDPNRATWNATHEQGFTIYDDFVLNNETTIDTIEYNIFQNYSDDYIQTYISILDEDPVAGNPVLPEFSIVATSITPNGLQTGNISVRNGFTHTIDGLNIRLLPGVYFLGISIDLTPTVAASIGSGPGSSSTIGPGLYQNTDVRNGEYALYERFLINISVPGPACWYGAGDGK